MRNYMLLLSIFLFILLSYSGISLAQSVCAGYALNLGNGNVTQEGPVGVTNFTATANQSGNCRDGDNIATFDGPPFNPPTTQTAQVGSRCPNEPEDAWDNNYLEFCIEAEPACTITLSEFNFLAGTNLEGPFIFHLRTDQDSFATDLFTCQKDQAGCENIEGNDGGDPRPPNPLALTSISLGALDDVMGTRCFRILVSDGDADDNIKVINFNDVEILCSVECADTLIDLSPDTATNELFTDHTVTATIETGGIPDQDILVTFEVISGPNAGEISNPDSGECSPNDDCTTDENGMVSWTYTGNGGLGIDTIVASFFNENLEQQVESNIVTKTWVFTRNVPTISEWGLIATAGLLGIIGFLVIRRRQLTTNS